MTHHNIPVTPGEDEAFEALAQAQARVARLRPPPEWLNHNPPKRAGNSIESDRGVWSQYE